MASEPVRSTAVVAAPKDYSIPGAQQIRLLSVRASFIDNGAASDWVPALELLDNNGNVLATAGDKGVTVTAGSSADVTWFPGVKTAGAASTGTGAAWFWATRNTNFTVTTATPQRRIPWTHFVTSDPTVFSVTTGLAANDTVNGLKAGIYYASSQVSWASPQTYPHSTAIVTDFFGVSGLSSSPVSDSTTDTTPVGESQVIHDTMLAITQAVPGEISLTVKNWDASNHNVVQALYAIMYLPNSTLVT